MKILVKAQAGAKTESIESIHAADDSALRQLRTFKVRVSAPAIGGKANERIMRIIARHFGVPLARIRIVSGHGATQKIIEIGEAE